MSRELLAKLRWFFANDPDARLALPNLRRWTLFGFVWLLVCEVVLVLQVYPTTWYFDELLTGKRPSVIYGISTVIFVAYLGGLFMYSEMTFWRNGFSHYLMALWRSSGHRKELELSASWHIKHGTGEKEALVAKNINRLFTFADYFMFDAVPILIRIPVTALFMIIFGWKISLLAITTLIAFGLMSYRNQEALRGMVKEYHDGEKELDRYGSELTQNWRTIQDFGLEVDFSEKNKSLNTDFADGDNPRHRRWRRCLNQSEVVITISRYCLYLLMGYEYLSGTSNLSIGSIALATAWMERSYSNYGRLSDFLRQLHRGAHALNVVLDVMKLVPEVGQPENPKWPVNIKGELTLENVGYSYPDGKEDALKNVSFTIPANRVTALVGPSGSGKTTLAQLLSTMHLSMTGEIQFDGVSLHEIDRQKYRRECLGVVSQQPQLFDGTILSNLLETNPSLTEAEAWEVLRLAAAFEFVSKLKDGIHTKIGENGIRLSGGQRQRLTIARALARKPVLMIFDEATSSLDPECQYEIQQAIDDLMRNRACTIVVIAHRLSTIRHADQIVIMEDGQVRECGAHEQLIEHSLIYRQFCRRELASFGADLELLSRLTEAERNNGVSAHV